LNGVEKPALTHTLAIILPAAGSSARYQQSGGLRSKLDEMLGDRPVLQRTCEIFSKFDDDEWNISTIIVAGPHDEESWQSFKDRHGDRLAMLGATICKGGKTLRSDTVRRALALVPSTCTHIAVHDAARPCLSHALLTRLLRAASTCPAVIPAMRVSDTIKRVQLVQAPAEADPLAAIFGEGLATTQQMVVQETMPRDNLVLVQTPQVFDASLLREAYADPDIASTDDAGLVEPILAKRGQRVRVVDGEASNIKLTYPEDLALARNILGLKEDGGRAAHKKF
jgi:2-C-methyl-D-erythritol 4-phosphate cytidylyltransferase